MDFEFPGLRVPSGLPDNSGMATQKSITDAPNNRRHRFQFSLRTLLLSVTMLAFASWTVLDHIRLVRERDDARQAEVEARQAEARAKRLLMMQINDPSPLREAVPEIPLR